MHEVALSNQFSTKIFLTVVFGCGIFNELLKLARFRFTSFLNFAINSALLTLRMIISGLVFNLGVVIYKRIALELRNDYFCLENKCLFDK